jgi:hypothetical protein
MSMSTPATPATAVRHGGDGAERDGPGEVAGLEGEGGAHCCFERGSTISGACPGGDGDLQAEAEVAGLVGDDVDEGERVAEVAQGREQLRQDRAVGVERGAAEAGDADHDPAGAAVPDPAGIGPGDAGIAEREVAVVGDRDDAAEGERVHGRVAAGVGEVSASSPPAAGSGFVASFSPSGRSSRSESWPERTLPAAPRPRRYSATMLSRPAGGRAPDRPSPNWMTVSALSVSRVAKTRPRGSRAWRSGSSDHSTPSMRTESVLSTPVSVAARRWVTGFCFRRKRWKGWPGLPAPRISVTLSPWLAGATLPWMRKVVRSKAAASGGLQDQAGMRGIGGLDAVEDHALGDGLGSGRRGDGFERGERRGDCEDGAVGVAQRPVAVPVGAGDGRGHQRQDRAARDLAAGGEGQFVDATATAARRPVAIRTRSSGRSVRPSSSISLPATHSSSGVSAKGSSLLLP